MENHDVFFVILESDLQSFIKNVNRFTKTGWRLRGDLQIDEKGNFVQVVTIKSNTVVWSGDDIDDSDSDENA